MAILLWLIPALVATLLAMAWVAWVARARPVGSDRSDAAQARFAEAIARPLPTSTVRRRRPHERSTGVALRREASSHDQSA